MRELCVVLLFQPCHVSMHRYVGADSKCSAGRNRAIKLTAFFQGMVRDVAVRWRKKEEEEEDDDDNDNDEKYIVVKILVSSEGEVRVVGLEGEVY